MRRVARSRGGFEAEVEQIVLHVMATRRKGRREAKRLVGRRLTQETLANWRVYGMFPVGFRNGSKSTPARVHLDGGRGR
ncbi:hypothetical protein [Aeromicrobium sp. WCS2018Hpa-31]|uniref:hypothetical protein n=1 Tax=Aeromicrobium sp. WCS2018Hpa-31 TaxID=3073628 RepID=UPI002882DA90|nr:hypothetical protein [Aeromicrobium sp. WCS2018Hpa-31]